MASRLRKKDDKRDVAAFQSIPAATQSISDQRCKNIKSLTEAEIVELGESLVLWVKINSPLHLSQWYTLHRGMTYSQWKQLLRRPAFQIYYEKAARMIGLEYLDGEKQRVKDSISLRFLRYYFPDLKDFEDNDHKTKLMRELKSKIKELDHIAKQKISSTIPPNDSIIETENENMQLRGEVAALKSQLKALLEGELSKLENQ